METTTSYAVVASPADGTPTRWTSAVTVATGPPLALIEATCSFSILSNTCWRQVPVCALAYAAYAVLACASDEYPTTWLLASLAASADIVESVNVVELLLTCLFSMSDCATNSRHAVIDEAAFFVAASSDVLWGFEDSIQPVGKSLARSSTDAIAVLLGADPPDALDDVDELPPPLHAASKLPTIASATTQATRLRRSGRPSSTRAPLVMLITS